MRFFSSLSSCSLLSMLCAWFRCRQWCLYWWWWWCWSTKNVCSSNSVLFGWLRMRLNVFMTSIHILAYSVAYFLSLLLFYFFFWLAQKPKPKRQKEKWAQTNLDSIIHGCDERGIIQYGRTHVLYTMYKMGTKYSFVRISTLKFVYAM